ncbi:nrv2 (predicted) [Pycnogonum litorale]
MDINMKDEVPLKDIDADATPDEKDTSDKFGNEPNEEVPLKDDADAGQMNHDEHAEGKGTEGKSWKEAFQSRRRMIIFIVIVLLALLIIVLVVLVLNSDSKPDMLTPKQDNRVSLLLYHPNGAGDMPLNLRKHVIHFSSGHDGNWMDYKKELDALLANYTAQNPGLMAQFITTDCHEEKNYGYDAGKPCIFIQFNKIKNWSPVVYSRQEVNLKNSTLPAIMKDKYWPNLVYLTCEGDTSADRENAGKIIYYPRSGFFVSSFPYADHQYYTAPMIAIQLPEPAKGVAIGITCKLWAKNVNHTSDEEPKGIIYFVLLIE